MRAPEPVAVDPVAAGAPGPGEATTPSRRRLAALCALAFVALGAWRFRDELFLARTVQSDLAGYLRAFDRLERGASPYDDPNYLYTPAFAVVGNAADRALGARAFVQAFRGGCLLSAGLLVWLSLRQVRWPWPAQLGAASLVVASGLLDNGIHCANATVLLAGPLTAALLLGERHPWPGGAAAGTLNAMKPLAMTALAVVATPARGRRPGRQQLAAAGAAAVAILLWLAVRHDLLPAMLRRSGGLPEQGHQLSLHRALYQLGIHVPAALVFALVTLAACALVWRHATSHGQRVAIGLAASALAVPVVNPSTLLLTLPLQVLALDRAAAAWSAARGDRWRRGAELALVAAAVVGVHGALGTVAVHDLPPPLGGLVTLIPHLETTFLAVYALLRAPRGSSTAREPTPISAAAAVAAGS
jgi:hypothetical protein